MRQQTILAAALLATAGGWCVLAEWSVGPCTLEWSATCSDSGVLFYLFTSSRRHEPSLVPVDGASPPPIEEFDPRRPTKVIVHGYIGGVDFNVTKMVREAYLSAGGLNMLVVDWGHFAAAPCYPGAVLNTLYVGRCLGKLLSRLQISHEPIPLELHLVGHSLGSHISAFAANYYTENVGRKISRITGLDPALPFFATLKRPWKLDATDADFVDVIHTNAGVFGKIEPVGDVDFYVNGGTHQPACREAKNEPVCSHLMSAVYFAESVDSTVGFWGTPCPNYWQYALGWCPSGEQAWRQAALMGEHCPRGTLGVFLVDTAESPPFALGNTSFQSSTTFRKAAEDLTSYQGP